MIASGVVINERYRVTRPIGEGGMGAVYEGEHLGVGRKIAIKFLHPEYARVPEIVERFQREARAAGGIGHDNIIEVLDFGVHDGAPFMVMEHLRGESLGSRLKRVGRLTAGEAAPIIGQVLSALAAAHVRGIVHRDLKPDNVFLVTKGSMKDFVKLLDFGISKFARSEGESKGLTQTGALIGTPYYMAPEQALAKRDVDHRADLYSAGVMLYEMVAGVLPFEAESQTEVLFQIIYRPKGLTPPREHNPELPAEFEAVILKAMSLERDDRYADAAAFAQALEPWGGTIPIEVGDAAPALSAEVPTGPGSTAGSAVGVRSMASMLAATATPVNWEKTASGTRADGTRDAASAASVPEAAASPVPAAPPRRSAGALIALGAVVGMMAVVGGVFLTRRREPAAQPQPASTATAALGTPAAPAPATVAIDLEQLPPGAAIAVDGRPVDSPHLRFPHGSVHTVRVTVEGRQPFETRVTADRDRAIVVAMLPAEPQTAEPATAAATETPPGEAPPEDPEPSAAGGGGSDARRGRVRRAGRGASGTPAGAGTSTRTGPGILPLGTQF